MPDDLHSRLKAAVEERLAVARAAGGRSWLVVDVPPFTDPLLLAQDGDGDTLTTLGTVDVDMPARSHLSANDPARIIRDCERDLRALERHRPKWETVQWWDAPTVGEADVCATCGNREPVEWELGYGNYGVKPEGWVDSYVLWPCNEILDLATAYEIEVDGA